MGDPAAARSTHVPLREKEHAGIELFPRIGPTQSLPPSLAALTAVASRARREERRPAEDPRIREQVGEQGLQAVMMGCKDHTPRCRGVADSTRCVAHLALLAFS